MSDIVVVGVPFNSAGRTGGVAAGPSVLRAAGILDSLALAGRVVDAGDVAFATPDPRRSPSSGLAAEQALTSMVDGVQAKVLEAFDSGQFPVLLGGDCPILLGALAAARHHHGRVGLLFVDGHEDSWPPKRSPTGEAADSELGLALGVLAEDVPGPLRGLLPLLDAADVALLGPRDAGELAEHDIASLSAEVELHTADDLQVEPGATAAAAARRVAAAGAWWLHLDLDVLSTGSLAAVDYAQEGGLDWNQLRAVVVASFSQPGCVGWSIAIYNPELDPTRRDADRIVAFVRAVAPAVASARR